jgi:hypothetical protein
MPALGAGIHVFLSALNVRRGCPAQPEDVDARHKAGHDALVPSCAGLTRASIVFARALTKVDGLPGHKRVHARLPTRYARQ